jgi:hypothetical protein
MLESSCKYYQDAKCIKKNAFCDLKCDIDGFEEGIRPLSDPSATLEVEQGDSEI